MIREDLERFWMSSVFVRPVQRQAILVVVVVVSVAVEGWFLGLCCVVLRVE